MRSTRPGPAVAVVLLLTALGAVITAISMWDQVVVAPTAALLGAAICLGAPALASVLAHRTRLRDAVGRPALLALAWGGLGTALPVMLAQGPAQELMTRLGWTALTDSFAGAWPEEIAKGLGVALVLVGASRAPVRARDGLVLGVACGLGFELVETAGYALSDALAHPSSDLAGALGSWQGRELFLGAGAHALWTGTAGWGLARAVETRRAWWAVIAPLAGLALHMAWNARWPEAAVLPAWVVVYALSLGALAVCAAAALREPDGAAGPSTQGRLRGGAPRAQASQSRRTEATASS